MSVRTFLLVLLGLVGGLAVLSPAFAEDDLALKTLFAEPGVKLVVVEFYADWCKPCKAAAPQWNLLHKRYAELGLRFVVVSVNEQGLCSNPGWSPDKMLCDLDGSLQKEWNVEKLPMSFLLSWQGERLVYPGDYNQISRAIEYYFKNSPRLVLSHLTDGDDAEIADPNDLRGRVLGLLAKQAKFDIIASGSEIESIRRLRAESFGAAKSEGQRCELGHELSANTEVKIKQLGTGANRKLSLQAYSVESGCLVASGEAPLAPQRVDKAVGTAVEQLIYDFMGRKNELKSRGEDKELKQQGIMVMPLERKQGASDAFVESVSGLITTETQRFSGLKVVSEADIRSALQSQEALSRCTGGSDSPNCLLAWRESLGVSQVVSGDLAQFEDYWVINLRLINSRDADVLGRVGRKIKGDQAALLESLSGIVAELFGTKAPEETKNADEVVFVGKPGVLEVSTNPNGAELWMQGKMLGKTPLKQQSPAGVYSIELRLAGYKTLSKEVDIKAGKSTTELFELERVYPMNPYKKGAHAAFWTGLGLAAFGGVAAWQAVETANEAKRGNTAANHAWSGLSVTGFVLGGAGMITGIVLWAIAPTDKDWWERHQVGASLAPGGQGAYVSIGGRW